MLLPNFILPVNFYLPLAAKVKVKYHRDSWSHFYLFKVIILQGKRDFVLFLFEL